MAAMANALDDEAHGKVCLWGCPRDGSIRLPTLADRLKERFAPMADAGADPLVVCLGRSRPMSKFFGEPDASAGSCDTLHVRLSPPRCPRLEALQRKIVDGLFLPPRPLWPKSLRIPQPYRRDLMIRALAFALAVLAMARAAMAVRRWRRARDHTS